jgi:hypothetical protein
MWRQIIWLLLEVAGVLALIGYFMWKSIMLLLLAVAALVVATGLMNARPSRCPFCHRINVFRRTRTGRKRDENDQEGTWVRTSMEFVCRICKGSYWIVRDDFEGCYAKVSLGSEGNTEASGASARRGN